MNSRTLLLLLACGPLALACQQMDNSAGSQDPPLDFGSVADPGDNSIPAQTDTPKILLPNGDTTTDPCDKVRADATSVLQAHCVTCHEGASPQGKPLNFIMETDQLISTPTSTDYATSVGMSAYVKPGDPDHSLVYYRAAIKGDMPKKYNDVRFPDVPDTSLSENSVLRQWIAACM